MVRGVAKLDPRHMLTVRKVLAPKVAAAAEVKRQALFDALSPGPRSGIQYPQLPRQSSAPGENPQYQSGDLRDMVGAEKVTDLLYDVGMFPKTEADRRKATALEYGYIPGGLAARGYLERVKSDPVSTREAKEGTQKG